MGRLPALLALLTLASSPVLGARQLGTATRVSGPDKCERAECYVVEVTCPEVLEPIRATLRVHEPILKSAQERGTILFTTGGGGAALWTKAYGRPAKRALRKLRKNGFRAVELMWQTRWLDAARGEQAGQARLACRPATLAQWVYDNLHPQGAAAPLCATGNSGGSAQISYMLSHYGLEDILSAIVPTGGPPMTRMDLGCFGEQDPGLPSMIYGSSPSQTIDNSWGFYDQDGPCLRNDTSFRGRLERASIGGRKLARYVFDETLIWFVLGEDDHTSALGQGTMFYDLLEEAGTPLLGLSLVKATPHRTPSVKKGANRIRDVLLEGCILWR